MNWEFQILALLIEEPDRYIPNAHKFSEDLFSNVGAKIVFTGVEKCIQAGQRPNIANIIDKIGGTNSGFVTQILNEMPEPDDFDSILDLLVFEMKHRKYRKLIQDSIEQIDTPEELNERIQALSVGLQDLNIQQTERISHISEGLDKMFRQIDQNLREDNAIIGFPSGIHRLDQHLGGFQKQDLIILAADTSQGKTALAITVIVNGCLMHGKKAGFWTMEMSDVQLTARMASQVSQISSKDILTKKLLDHQIQKIQSSTGGLAKAGIYIDECISSSMSYIVNSIRKQVMVNGIDIAIVDYLGLIKGEEKGGREQEVAGIARGFKNLAKELDIPIIALHQLSRKQNSRPGQRPQLSDLRDSGQVEEAADVVVLLYRPEYYGIDVFEDGTPSYGMGEIIIAKGRNIGIKDFILKFTPAFTLWGNVDEYQAPDTPQDADFTVKITQNESF